MMNLGNWHKHLHRQASNIFITLCLFIFLCLEFIVLSRALGDHYYSEGLRHIEKTRSFSQGEEAQVALSYQRGIKMFERSLRFNRNSSKTYFEFGDALSQVSKNSAKAQFIAGILREPTDGLMHQRLADIQDSLEDDSSAQKELSNAIMLDPHNMSMNLYLAQYYYSKKKEKEFEYYLLQTAFIYRNAAGGGVEGEGRVAEFLKLLGREALIKK